MAFFHAPTAVHVGGGPKQTTAGQSLWQMFFLKGLEAVGVGLHDAAVQLYLVGAHHSDPARDRLYSLFTEETFATSQQGQPYFGSTAIEGLRRPFLDAYLTEAMNRLSLMAGASSSEAIADTKCVFNISSLQDLYAVFQLLLLVDTQRGKQFEIDEAEKLGGAGYMQVAGFPLGTWQNWLLLPDTIGMGALFPLKFDFGGEGADLLDFGQQPPPPALPPQLPEEEEVEVEGTPPVSPKPPEDADVFLFPPEEDKEKLLTPALREALAGKDRRVPPQDLINALHGKVITEAQVMSILQRQANRELQTLTTMCTIFEREETFADRPNAERIYTIAGGKKRARTEEEEQLLAGVAERLRSRIDAYQASEGKERLDTMQAAWLSSQPGPGVDDSEATRGVRAHIYTDLQASDLEFVENMDDMSYWRERLGIEDVSAIDVRAYLAKWDKLRLQIMTQLAKEYSAPTAPVPEPLSAEELEQHKEAIREYQTALAKKKKYFELAQSVVNTDAKLSHAMDALILTLAKVANGDPTVSMDDFKKDMDLYGAQMLSMKELLPHVDKFASWATNTGENAITLQERVRKLVKARVDLQDYLISIAKELQMEPTADLIARIRSLQTEHAELEKSVASLRAELQQRETAYQKEMDALKAVDAVLKSGNLKAAQEMAKKLGAETENEARLRANLQTRIADIQLTHTKEIKALEIRLATAEAAVNELPILRAKIASNEVREKEMEDTLRAEIERQKMMRERAVDAGRFLQTIAAAPPNVRQPIKGAQKARTTWAEDLPASKPEELREEAKAAGSPMAPGKEGWAVRTPEKGETIPSEINPIPPSTKRSQIASPRVALTPRNPETAPSDINPSPISSNPIAADYEKVGVNASPVKRRLENQHRLEESLNIAQLQETLKPGRSGAGETTDYNDEELNQILRDDIPAVTNAIAPAFPRITLAGILAAHPEAEAAIWAYIGRKENENLGGDVLDPFDAAVRSLLQHIQSLSVPHEPVRIEPPPETSHLVPDSEAMTATSTEKEEKAIGALMPPADKDVPRGKLRDFQVIFTSYIDKIYPLTTRTPAATVASVTIAYEGRRNAFKYFFTATNRLADVAETWQWKDEDLPHTTLVALTSWMLGTAVGDLTPTLVAYYRDRLQGGDDPKAALADLYHRMRLFAGWIQMKVKSKPSRRVTRSRAK